MRNLSAFVPASWEQTILDHTESLVVNLVVHTADVKTRQVQGGSVSCVIWGIIIYYLLFGQPYSWVSCSWSTPYRGRAAGSGSVQTDYHQFLGGTPGRSELSAEGRQGVMQRG